jgi:hypothetical protein
VLAAPVGLFFFADNQNLTSEAQLNPRILSAIFAPAAFRFINKILNRDTEIYPFNLCKPFAPSPGQ